MRVIDLIETGALELPWPVSVDSKVFGGRVVQASPICQKKCGMSPVCADSNSAETENCCEFGVSYFKLQIRESFLTIFGVRGPKNPNASIRSFKESLRGRSVTEQEVLQWSRRISSLLDTIDAEFLKRQSELLDPLHDPIRLAEQIETIAHRLIQVEADGSAIEEQIDNASIELKSLVKAAGLLSESFNLMTIYFNPAAASYGKKVSMSIHGLLRKMVAIFSIPDPNEDVREPPHIYLNGNSYRTVSVYESFKLIPFALISNARKYSLQGAVRVTLTERASGTEVSVESQGPLIEPNELDRIFDKRFRGRWAQRATSEGSGVGLYLARVVAVANGLNIRVMSSRLQDRYVGGIPIAINRFSFEVPL